MTKERCAGRCLRLVVFLLITLGFQPWSFADESAFLSLPDGERKILNDNAWAKVKQSRIRNRVVTEVHHARLHPSLASPHITVNATLVFVVSPGTPPVKVVIDRQETVPGGVTWHGHVPGDPHSSAYLVFEKNGESLFGDIRIQGTLYEIRPSATKGILTIYTVDPRQFPPDHPSKNATTLHHDAAALSSADGNSSGSSGSGTSPGGVPGVSSDAVRAATGSGTFELTTSGQPILIDVMVLYTAAAKTQAGIPDIIAREVCQAVNEIRDSFINNAIKPIIRLVHHGILNLSESYSGDARTRLDFMLADLRNNVAAKSLRDQYNADVVSLWVSDAIFDGLPPNQQDVYCGMSPPVAIPDKNKSPEAAFSLVLENCFSNRSVTHEFGHILGSHDDRLATYGSQNDTFYNYGYVLPMKGWRTIMGIDRATCLAGHCNRLNFWSNPTISYPSGSGYAAGVQIGTATTSDSGPAYNALFFDSTVGVVADFRSPPKPISGLGNVSCGIVTDLTPPAAPWNLDVR